MKKVRKSTAVLLTLSMLLLLFASFTATAAGAEYISEASENGFALRTVSPEITQTSDGRIYVSAKKITTKTAWSYPTVSLNYAGRKIAADTRQINGMTYVAVRAFINEVSSMSVVYKSATRTLYISGQGLDMEIIDGSNIIYANGRTLYSISPNAIMSNGSMYAPLHSLAKALSLTFGENSAQKTATLSGTVKALTPGSRYYDQDAIYWLSRIISAESKGEPLLGQIAVGNIVLNRVRSEQYPNTIWGVIFDRKYGVQFSPIINGTIYETPSAPSVTAAKICLETYSVVDEALFFLQPKIATSSWIPQNRTYLFTIGNHDFYQ